MLVVHERFQHPRTIQFAETDLSGAVHFTSVLRYVEEAEHSFLRAKNMPICDGNIFLPRVHISCDYRKPLHCFDSIIIDLEVLALGRTSTSWGFFVARDGIICAEGKMITVSVQIMPP